MKYPRAFLGDIFCSIYLFIFAYFTNFFTVGVEIIIFDEILNFLFGKLAFYG